MALTQLSDIFPKLTGFLRSSHAVLAVLAIICLFFFYFSKDLPAFSFVAYGSFVLFSLLLAIVVIRFGTKGPEADRLQSVVTISHTETRITNIEPELMGREFLMKLIKALVALRQPLPPPTGTLQGPASDPASIKELSVEDAARLSAEDSAQQRLIEE